MGQVEDLRLFVIVVDNQSISGAADKLHIAKSAVSRRLGLLEERFGATLIDRQPGTWQVTALGQELYQRAVRVVSEAEEIDADFKQVSQHIEGPLSVSVPNEFGTTFLSPALIEFCQAYPSIQLTVDFENRSVDLARENFDLAVRITPEEIDDSAAEEIGQSGVGLFASRDYLERRGTPQNISELAEHDILNYGSAKRQVWQFECQGGVSESISFRPALNSNSGVFLLDAALSGMGIARLPEFVLQAAGNPKDLVQLFPDCSLSKLRIYLIRDENRRLNRRMRSFAASITKACNIAGG